MNYCVTLYEQKGRVWHIKDIQILWAEDRASLDAAVQALHQGPYTVEVAHGCF